MSGWIDALQEITGSGKPACLVTVADIRGSAPREAGARMLVTPNGTIGSIGGGQLEYQCSRIAAEQLKRGRDAGDLLRRFPLGTSCGQCCGGVVEMLFEPVCKADADWLADLVRLRDLRREFVAISSTGAGRALATATTLSSFGMTAAATRGLRRAADDLLASRERTLWLKGQGLFCERIAPADFTIALFGAGHVGSALVSVLAALDCQVRWIDGRRNIFPPRLPANVDAIPSGESAREVAAIPAGAYYLIMTHSHALDFEICARVLRRGDARYCGLIGSRSKRRRFESLMRRQGMTDDVLSQLVSPIGVDRIPGKRPADIAVAVAAELLQTQAAHAEKTAATDARAPSALRASATR